MHERLANGINAYAAVPLLGLFGATGPTDAVPVSLQRTDVLAAAGVLFLCEAVADRIPYVDSAWDAARRVVRPVSGAVVAALPAGAAPRGAASGRGGVPAARTSCRRHPLRSLAWHELR